MRLFDTYTRSLVELPAAPGPVRMYICGPTVYARVHVGNARPFILGMWLRSWLRQGGYEVRFVHNITDVNDKIYEAAPGSSAELARQATAWYLEDISDLGLGLPDELPKATESVPEIVAFIGRLVEAGFAYAVDGDVYFRVARFADYGRLSRQRPDRVVDGEPNPRKEDPRDFALWKATKEGEDTSWPSPWSEGRPGWHIECSVMAEQTLGESFEIHGGGLDLVFPHHENELAQSRALGHPFARIWAHNGLLELTGEKMSKSVGNIATLREAIDRYGREALLVYFLGGHWRKPIDFSDDQMLSAQSQWLGFQGAFRVPESIPPRGEWDRFVATLENDFNTVDALALLHEWRSRGYWRLLDAGLQLFGLGLPPMAGTGMAHHHMHRDQAAQLKESRDAARASKDWHRADQLRLEIRALGFDVIDDRLSSRLIPLEQ